MQDHRPSTPQSYLKVSQSDKWKHCTPTASSKLSEKVTTISQKSEMDDSPQFQDFSSKQNQEISELRQQLSKCEEKNYILQHFFRKLEKVLYSEHSDLLASENTDY